MWLGLLGLLISGCASVAPSGMSSTEATSRELKSSVPLDEYRRWLTQQKFLKAREKTLTFTYLDLLKNPNPSTTTSLVRSLKSEAQKKKAPVVFDHFGFFKTSPESVYKSQSLATLSQQYFVPRLTSNHPEMIELFLI